jgi:hypothetical protein
VKDEALWLPVGKQLADIGVAACAVNVSFARRAIAFVAAGKWHESINDDVYGGPALHGKAFCNGCRHQWVAVAEVPATSEFECPSCHALKGVFERHVLYTRRGLKHWHCLSCEGLLFSLAIGSSMEPVLCCANCGSAADLIDAFPA